MAKRIRWQETIYKIIELLRDGPKYPDEIKGGKRDKTVERALNALIRAKLIEKREDGRYYLVNEYEKIESAEEYILKREHSLKLIEDYLKTRNLEYLLTNQYLRRHLETGYPDIMQQLVSWKSCLNELKNLQNEFEEILKEEAERIKSSAYILKEIVEGAFILEKRTPEKIAEIVSFDNLFEVIAFHIKSREGPINLEALTPEYVLNLLDKVESIYKKISEVKKRCEKLYDMLQRDINDLISEVFYGAVLRGYCQACPPKVKKEQE